MVYFLFFFFLTKSEVGKANLSNKLNDLLTDQYGKYLWEDVGGKIKK